MFLLRVTFTEFLFPCELLFPLLILRISVLHCIRKSCGFRSIRSTCWWISWFVKAWWLLCRSSTPALIFEVSILRGSLKVLIHNIHTVFQGAPTQGSEGDPAATMLIGTNARVDHSISVLWGTIDLFSGLSLKRIYTCVCTMFLIYKIFLHRCTSRFQCCSQAWT